MNISFTSRHGEAVLTKAHQVAEIASKIDQQKTPLTDTDSLHLQAKLLDAQIGTDVLQKSAPEGNDSCYAHAELTEQALARMPKIKDTNLVEQLKTALQELTSTLSDAVSRHKDSLDGEDKTIGAMVNGTIKNIQSKMYG